MRSLAYLSFFLSLSDVLLTFRSAMFQYIYNQLTLANWSHLYLLKEIIEKSVGTLQYDTAYDEEIIALAAGKFLPFDLILSALISILFRSILSFLIV